MSRTERRRARARGRSGEGKAALWLRLKGYRILARDWRSPLGEVDIVAWRSGTLVLVEVKARPTLAEAAADLRPRQRARIARAAEAFRQRRPELADAAVRFDAVLVAPRRRPRHIIAAWRGTGEPA
jgi:putative endonuclease